MCCDTTLCSASGNDVGLPMARGMHAHIVATHGRSGSTISLIPQRGVHDAALRWPAVRNENESVRRCARRSGSHFCVAQASPLFSDHAPREVHLWQ
jgi:hypothetical protein